MKVKKVCLLGDFGVGKTSLVARFVNHTFSDKYLSTVGVSIKTKIINAANDEQMKLIIWDIAGEERFSTATERYIRGANGFLIVADGTRQETLEAARQLQTALGQMLGDVPSINLLNKADLNDAWVAGLPIEQNPENKILDGQVATSAKTGLNVEFAFHQLAAKLS